MTIEWARGLPTSLALVLTLIGLIGCAATVKNRTGDTLDVSQYPPDIQAAYKVFAVRCSRCHTLARPLNARIDAPQQWVRYVSRMRLNPASGINEKNGEIILRFLLYYMEQRARDGERGEDGESGGSSGSEITSQVSQPSAPVSPVVTGAPEVQ